MTLDEILNSWKADAPINKLNLGSEAEAIPLLHHKYLNMYVNENINLARLKSDYSILRHSKTTFLLDGATKETISKGWKPPAKGKILKVELETYLQADMDIVNLSLEISLQEEKCGALKSILESVKNRNFLLTNSIAWRRFQEGA